MMSGTENIGAPPPPPAADGAQGVPDTKAWNAQVDQALGQMGTSLLGGIMMQMMNSTKANGEEDG